MRVEATVGLTRPIWAAAAPDDEPVPAAGTINVVAFVPVRHSEAALANLLCTMTEAKVQALFEGGVPGDRDRIGCHDRAVPARRAGGAVRRRALSLGRVGGPGGPCRGALRDGTAVITLVLGGTRSGKSAVAEALVSRHGAARHLCGHDAPLR